MLAPYPLYASSSMRPLVASTPVFVSVCAIPFSVVSNWSMTYWLTTSACASVCLCVSAQVTLLARGYMVYEGPTSGLHPWLSECVPKALEHPFRPSHGPFCFDPEHHGTLTDWAMDLVRVFCCLHGGYCIVQCDVNVLYYVLCLTSSNG